MSVAFFFAMAWKSALISALALMLAQLLRSRAAAERAALLRVTICLLLALPLAALLMPAIPLELAETAKEMAPLLLPDPATVQAVAAAAAAPTVWDDPSELVLLLYLGGLAMVGARLLAGLWTLRRWTREAEPVLRSEWTEAMEWARDGRPVEIRLLVSANAESPLSWGWRRPVILIDRDSYALPEEADAIMAHEMAHVARGDWLTLVLARTAVALFWFNPLVWVIERMVMEDAEQAADRQAIARVEPARYAQTLLNFAALDKGNPLPANSIASGSLARRVQAILDGNLAAAPRISVATLAAMGASVAVAAPIGALQLVAPATPVLAPHELFVAAAAQPVPPAAPIPPAPSPVQAIPEPPAVPTAPAVVAIAASTADGTPAAVLPTPPAPPRSPAPPSAPAVPRAPSPPSVVALANWNSNPKVMFKMQVKKASDLVEQTNAFARAEAQRAVERAQRDIERAQALSKADIQRAVERAQREAERAHDTAARNVALSLEQSARGLERGADGMERGAQKMAEEARKLHSKSYREQQIAKAAARGEELCHDQLLEMAEQFEESAEDMMEGARGMRQHAREMREDSIEES